MSDVQLSIKSLTGHSVDEFRRLIRQNPDTINFCQQHTSTSQWVSVQVKGQLYVRVLLH